MRERKMARSLTSHTDHTHAHTARISISTSTLPIESLLRMRSAMASSSRSCSLSVCARASVRKCVCEPRPVVPHSCVHFLERGCQMIHDEVHACHMPIFEHKCKIMTTFIPPG